MGVAWLFLIIFILFTMTIVSFCIASDTNSNVAGFFGIFCLISVIICFGWIVKYCYAEKIYISRTENFICYWEEGQPYIREDIESKHNGVYKALVNLSQKLRRNINPEVKSVDITFRKIDCNQYYYGLHPVFNDEFMSKYKLNK